MKLHFNNFIDGTIPTFKIVAEVVCDLFKVILYNLV
jgi:hypothetical protein